MNAVGRLGSYISGPFHPFGGAVDIIVVEQQDGSLKSSNWYVRFGKFQGVLKTTEKVVNICVNGEEANFHMYLDHKGEAFFLREVDEEVGESVLYPSSSGDETDVKSDDKRRPLESKSCNFVVEDLKPVDQIDVSNENKMRRTNSRRSRIFGLVFGRRSVNRINYKGEYDVGTVGRNNSLERAEFAANLLEVNWSTTLGTNKPKKDNASRFTASNMFDGKVHEDMQIDTEKSDVISSVHDDQETSSCSYNEPVADSSQSGLERYVEETTLDLSCLIPPEKNVGSSTLLASVPDIKSEVMSEINESVVLATEEDENVDRGLSGISCADSQLIELQSCSGRKCYEEHVINYTDVILPGCGISQKECETDRLQTYIYYESSESSMVGKDASGRPTHEKLLIASDESGDVHVGAEMLNGRTELLSEDIVTKQLFDDVKLEARQVEEPENYSESSNPFHNCTNNSDVVPGQPTQSLKSCTQTVHLRNSFEETVSESMCNNSCCSNLGHQVQDEKYMKYECSRTKSPSSSGSISDSVMTDIGNVKEELFLFSDIDEPKVIEVESMESDFPVYVDRGNSPVCSPEGIKDLNESVTKSKESYSCLEISDQENQSSDFESSIGHLRSSSYPIGIPRSHSISGEEVGSLAESLPTMSSCIDNCGACDYLSDSLDSKSKSLKWTLQSKDDSISRKPSEDTEPQLAVELLDIKDAPVHGELQHDPAIPAVGDSSEASIAPSGNWRLWSFPFRRSSSGKAMQPASNSAEKFDIYDASEGKIGRQGDKNMLKSKVVKKMVRFLSPTSEQLASLNLKEGRNTVTFTFSTPMLGEQQINASIYLWKWNTRIVVSDVDGTITKSDVLGQFMPLVGVDWSQTGVAHLFSAIKENGYQLLFLSARSISQAYNTRQFLFNLKQDGKALPDGPVVISPDGLFPSLYREVIRRAPHEFKITCLEGIRSLFPSDCHPFYAGFGNRDTDELSYLKVGIPKGKIFIINPKGEVAVNRRIDTKSYRSLHALVNGMFPPAALSEQIQEDFNSWNFWRLPPPVIDH
ncbi:hypothetical protein FNV43_RR11853 [Rhamnella rubrinervis]|uniref:LNS2/PITP domain-containing protein n=1 Tax=Rhamnella rubrinervis TaxID=2594499 RepID=A0A8K0H6U1_9ROSA|nr:hypothetical protein FNV43_RR11853 [Rhamnella rubrinervis]